MFEPVRRTGIKITIFDFRFKFYLILSVFVCFLSWNWQLINFALCEMSFVWLQIIFFKYTGQ